MQLSCRDIGVGAAYPFGFFQLEMQGGIFQSCWSRTETARGGECITGTGGEPGPRGTFLCRNLGGSIGSIGMSYACGCLSNQSS